MKKIHGISFFCLMILSSCGHGDVAEPTFETELYIDTLQTISSFFETYEEACEVGSLQFSQDRINEILKAFELNEDLLDQTTEHRIWPVSPGNEHHFYFAKVPDEKDIRITLLPADFNKPMSNDNIDNIIKGIFSPSKEDLTCLVSAYGRAPVEGEGFFVRHGYDGIFMRSKRVHDDGKEKLVCSMRIYVSDIGHRVEADLNNDGIYGELTFYITATDPEWAKDPR